MHWQNSQVGPWCVPLPEGSRICHVRSNMGLDWAQNVLPEMEALSAQPSDIMVRLLPGFGKGGGACVDREHAPSSSGMVPSSSMHH